ncbi:MAG: hypothetical protein HYW04_03270 [Deltaproteobacteria bacterium]|nr:hypothetical protein [Deltaproteobacteria bacterium]
MIGNEREEDLLENPTEEEIICLWRSLQSSGLSEDEAWHAILTGIALDTAFARSKNLTRLVH